MIDLEHCQILGRESIDSNSLNRCIFNIFTKMGEFNSSFLNASSENVPQSPFFSGGYENALTDIGYVSQTGVTSSTTSNGGVVSRLYRGTSEIDNPTESDSFVTDSVTGAYTFGKDAVTSFAPTVDMLMRDETPLILRSFICSEYSEVTNETTLETETSPTIKYTSYMLGGNTGISFGTITFNRNNGNSQKNELSLDIKADLIGIYGVDRIKFFTIGNGMSSGVKMISENLDMVTDVGTCSITYNSDTDIVISNITKNDNGDEILVDRKTGRILDSDEEYDYENVISLSNSEMTLSFFIIFELKQNALKYSDDLWCFHIASSKEFGRNYLYSADGWAEGYSKYTFDNFEKADDGYIGADGGHSVWESTETETGGCVYTANDAFRKCYNATFKNLDWFSPRLRYANNMFLECKHATFDSLPKSLAFDSLREGKNMFRGCKSAKFSNVETISMKTASKATSMFAECDAALFSSLTGLTVAGNSSYMFDGDYSATFNSLNAIGGSATNLSYMFRGCDNARFEELETLSSDVENSYIYANGMFANIHGSKFNGLTRICFDSVCGYDGSSMFESCSDAEFANLTSLGNIKCGNYMFANIDDPNEDERYSNATFSKLHDIGKNLVYGNYMFSNDYTLSMTVTTAPSSLVYGNHMFENTSSVIIDSDIDSLVYAESMFSNTMTAVVKGDMDSLVNGSSMFSNCVSADVSGTMDSLVNMYNMFAHTDYAHISELPETAENMQASFSYVTGECLVEQWNPSVSERDCLQTFENSDNIRINGNILDGKIRSTRSMFFGSGSKMKDGKYIVLNNPDMNGDPTDSEHRYYTNSAVSNFAFYQNFDSSPLTAKMTFIGGCSNTDDSISSYSTSSDIKYSVLCFEKYDGENTTFDVYTVPLTSTAEDGHYVTFESELSEFEGASARIYAISNGTRTDYGTVTTENGDDTVSITFRKNGDDDYSLQSLNTYHSREFSENDIPQIQTFTVVDSVRMPETWTVADSMFYNVIQTSLLSGYDCFISESLSDTDYMFALDSFDSSDKTFDNAGKLFRKMGRSSISTMVGMFENRNISNITVFTDDYHDDYTCNKSFLIPYSAYDASSAFHNCSIDSVQTPYMYLSIPETLVGARSMFDGYSGPKIRLDYDEEEWIYLNEKIDPSRMFYGCEFYSNGDERYCISTPTAYLQMFNGSDFNLDRVVHLAIRDGKNFAYPYEASTRFFNNDIKMMGCSSVTLSSLKDDILDWFNAYSSTTVNAANIEGVYLATVVGPSNGISESGEITANYELMKGEYVGGVLETDPKHWELSMASRSSISDDMMAEIENATNYVRMDSITSLSNDNARITCMFNPGIMFYYTGNTMGDALWRIMENGRYAEASSESEGSIGDNLRNNKNSCYTMVTLSYVETVNAQEMPLAFMGLKNAKFENLKTIGDSTLAAYGAFMYCDAATFSSLSSIDVMQYDSEDTFTSRFVSSSEGKSAWYGNYNNMFLGDQNAEFGELERITFNTTNGFDSNGNEVRMWIDYGNELYYSVVNGSGETKSYRIDIYSRETEVSGTFKYTISVKDYVGNVLGGDSGTGYTLTYNTDVYVGTEDEFTYELCEIDGVVSVVITINDNSNKNSYFVANITKIYAAPMHPKNGYAKYDSGSLAVYPFTKQGAYYSNSFTDLNGNVFELSSGSQLSESELSATYTLDITDRNSGTVMKLGSAYRSDGSSADDKMYYTKLCYNSDGINYTAITILSSDTMPSASEIKYPDDAACYRIYDYNGNHYIDEMTVIPGTVEYGYIAKLEVKPSTIMSHKAFCSGMFKNCTKATFGNLTTICIPMTGSCAEMFSNCLSMSITGDHKLDSLILPESHTKYSYSDHEDYKKMFSGINVERIKLDSLTLDNTNLTKIGNPYAEDGKHHVIGEQLFDGMVIPNRDTRGYKTDGTYTANVSGNNKTPFTYQNAIFELNLDCDIADGLFDRDDNIHTVNFYDMFGALIRSVRVEYMKNGQNVYYPVSLPKYPETGSPFKYWNFTEKNFGSHTHVSVTDGTTSFGPITADYEVYATYENSEGNGIAAHDSDTVSSIMYHVEDSDIKYMATSFNSASSK